MQRNYTLDIMRIVACLAVVVCHSSGSLIAHHQVLPGTAWFDQCLAINAFTRWDVPFFVMLTGFFMLDPRRTVRVPTLYSKNILRIFTALLFWSLFYGLTLHRPLYPLGTQEGHLWYLGMIIGVYLAIPALRLVAANPTVLKYFSIVWLAAMCYQFVGHFTTLPVDFDRMVFVDYAGCVVYAFWLRSIFDRPDDTPRLKRLSRLVYALGIIGFALTLVLGIRSQNNDGDFYRFVSPNVLATATALLVFSIRHPLNLTSRTAALVENCSKCTFGIYLMHVWILVFTLNRIHRFVPQPIPMTLICVAVAFLLSYAVTFLLKKIPVVKNYIV